MVAWWCGGGFVLAVVWWLRWCNSGAVIVVL